jgi:hypothetical protein
MSSLTGWHSRAIAHPERSTFTPSKDTLLAGLIRSTPVQPSGLAIGLFLPDFAVDGAGRILQLTQVDWAGLEAIVKGATADSVPKAGGFRNSWRIAHPRTDLPIHWLRVSHGRGGDDIREVSVFGYSQDVRELVNSPDGVTTELPDVLQEVFGVLDEGRKDDGPGDGDPALVETIADIITNVCECPFSSPGLALTCYLVLEQRLSARESVRT